MLNTTGKSKLLEEIRNIHTGRKLCGEPQNALLNVSDDLLLYVLSLLRDETTAVPDASIPEWNDLLSALRSHWITPLLYWKVGHLPYELRPPEYITAQMRHAFMWSRARCFKMERQLRVIIAAFNRAGISVLVLKGPGLARSVYPDPATRPGSDLDLLVCPEQMIHARETLIDLGYKCLENRFETFRNFHRDEEFIHKEDSDNNICVEIHWALSMFSGSKWKVDINEIFSRSVKIDTPGLSFKILHPVDNLIHASLHMLIGHSQDVRLIWIYDCALLARHLTLTDDWEMLIQNSKARETHIVLKNALKMAQLWSNLKIPVRFRDLYLKPETSDIEDIAWSDPIQWRSRQISKFTFNLFFSNNLSPLKKLLQLFHIIFPHPDIVRMKYPPSHSWLLPLSYMRRWWKWIKELSTKR
jgi:hypothetical protein